MTLLADVHGEVRQVGTAVLLLDRCIVAEPDGRVPRAADARADTIPMPYPASEVSESRELLFTGRAWVIVGKGRPTLDRRSYPWGRGNCTKESKIGFFRHALTEVREPHCSHHQCLSGSRFRLERAGYSRLLCRRPSRLSFPVHVSRVRVQAACVSVYALSTVTVLLHLLAGKASRRDYPLTIPG